MKKFVMQKDENHKTFQTHVRDIIYLSFKICFSLKFLGFFFLIDFRSDIVSSSLLMDFHLSDGKFFVSSIYAINLLFIKFLAVIFLA